MSEPDTYNQAEVLQQLSDDLKATREPAPQADQVQTSAPEHEASGDAPQVVTSQEAPAEGSTAAPTPTKRSPARPSAGKTAATQESPA